MVIVVLPAGPSTAAGNGGVAPPASPLARDIAPLRRDERGRIVAIPKDRAKGDENGTDSGRRTTGRIGGLRRDNRGRIVRAAPSEPRVASPVPAWAPNTADYDTAAREAQRQVDEVHRLCRQRQGHNGTDACLRPLLDRLAARDSEVRTHEMAHYHSGRPFTRTPRYWYVIGPRGRRYVVTGTTAFDMSAIPGDSAGTNRKWHLLKRAALAPQTPSPRDLDIAAEIDRRLATPSAQ